MMIITTRIQNAPFLYVFVTSLLLRLKAFLRSSVPLTAGSCFALFQKSRPRTSSCSRGCWFAVWCSWSSSRPLTTLSSSPPQAERRTRRIWLWHRFINLSPTSLNIGHPSSLPPPPTPFLQQHCPHNHYLPSTQNPSPPHLPLLPTSFCKRSILQKPPSAFFLSFYLSLGRWEAYWLPYSWPGQCGWIL